MEQSIALLRRSYEKQRAFAIASYRQQRSKPERLLNRISLITDRTLRELIEHAPLPANAALAAVGGYGRCELYPHSDVDVLILLKNDPDSTEIDAIERFIAAMWDVGLEPSHSVRTIEQSKHLAHADVTIETALLEARWLAGDKERIGQLLQTIRQQLDPQAFFLAKRAEMLQRHAYYHDTPYSLEPNCKESPGALRDLQLLLWLAQAAGYGASWHEVLNSGALTAAEYRSVRRAERAFSQLRIELHLMAGRRDDRLLFDVQPALAGIYGFKSTPTRSPSELLMQRYYWAARVVSQLSTILIQSIEEKIFISEVPSIRLDEGFHVRQGRLDLHHEDGFARNPALIFRSFLYLQQHPELKGMTARTLRALWHARRRIDSQFRSNPINHDLFLRILKQPDGVADTLYRMTSLNILPRYLPVFRRVVGQMQHDLFHAYTVDEHTLKVIQNLNRFVQSGHADEYPRASQLMMAFDQPWLIYIAALFHDIAKGRGGQHAELGAADARRFCHQHRINDSESDLVVFLVRHHLLMSNVAQKRDLSDPHVIHSFAEVVDTERRLQALYLLTVADIRATSPTLWNSWKGKLLEDLYQRTLIVLGGMQPDTSTVLVQRKDDAAQAIQALGVTDEQRMALWDVLDSEYFLRHEPNEIAWHAEQLAHRLKEVQAVVRARVIGRNEALQVMVYTPDRPDLFAAICQYFDRHTFNIQDARIHTTKHGWALDSFVVLFARPDTDYRNHVGIVQRDLAVHLSQPVSDNDWLHTPPYRRCGSAQRRARAFPIIPQADLQYDERNASWRLSIVCADRAGLLYALSTLFSAQQIQLKMAKIHTLGERVEDVFILDGAPLSDADARIRFKRAILAVLAGC